MGTGAVSILLHTFPYPARWLYWLSVAAFCVNTLLFATLTLIILMRFILYPAQWSVMLNDTTQSLYIAAWPMGLSQIIFMMIYVCSPIWSSWVTYLAWAMWMLDAALSIVVSLLIPFLHMKTKAQRELSSFTALEMFPFLTCVVASGTGAVVSTALSDPQQAFGTVIVSYILLGISLPMALITTTIYTQRLMLQKLPPRTTIVSVFLPVGPPCMGGLAAINLGQTCLNILPKMQIIDPLAGVVFYSLGVLCAIMLWGFASLWLGLAVFTVCYTRRFEFNLGWWAFTFPVALFASVSIKIGEIIASRFFRVFGAIVAVGVILLWMMVSVMTIKGVFSGKLFEHPTSLLATPNREAGTGDFQLAEAPLNDDRAKAKLSA